MYVYIYIYIYMVVGARASATEGSLPMLLEARTAITTISIAMISYWMLTV